MLCDLRIYVYIVVKTYLITICSVKDENSEKSTVYPNIKQHFKALKRLVLALFIKSLHFF